MTLTSTEIRLQGLEMMMTHVLTVLAVHAEPCASEHMKGTLLERGARIDRSSLSRPTDQTEIEVNEKALRFYLGRILSHVEEDERAARRRNHLPDVRPVVATMLGADAGEAEGK